LLYNCRINPAKAKPDKIRHKKEAICQRGVKAEGGSQPFYKRVAMRFFGDYNRDQKLFIVESMLMNQRHVITTGVF